MKRTFHQFLIKLIRCKIKFVSVSLFAKSHSHRNYVNIVVYKKILRQIARRVNNYAEFLDFLFDKCTVLFFHVIHFF